MLGARGAAIHLASGLDPVADDLAAAMGARGSHCLDRAFEAVEGHRTAGAPDLERFIVIVAADIACRHRMSPSHVAIACLLEEVLPATERAQSEV